MGERIHKWLIYAKIFSKLTIGIGVLVSSIGMKKIGDASKAHSNHEYRYSVAVCDLGKTMESIAQTLSIKIKK